MHNKKNKRTMYVPERATDGKNIKEKKILEEAQTVLLEYDDGFMLRKPSCEELPDVEGFCREMDLFELYICVLVKELIHGRNVEDAVWDKIDLSGREIAYPYIEKIWDTIKGEYEENACLKMGADSIFSGRVKRCGLEPENRGENTSAVADLVFYINKERARENKYYALIAFLCMYSKQLYDKMKETDSWSDMEDAMNKMLDDYDKQKIESDVIKGIFEIAQKKRKKILEKLLYNGKDSFQSNNIVCEGMFWEMAAGDWDNAYGRGSGGQPQS